MFTGCKWKKVDLETGKDIESGSISLEGKATRLIGPGINNAVISRLRKGEHIEYNVESLNLKMILTPYKSAMASRLKP